MKLSKFFAFIYIIFCFSGLNLVIPRKNCETIKNSYRQADRQTNRQTGRQTDRQTGGNTECGILMCACEKVCKCECCLSRFLT